MDHWAAFDYTASSYTFLLTIKTLSFYYSQLYVNANALIKPIYYNESQQFFAITNYFYAIKDLLVK